jgi:hypothetical protein
MTGSLSYEPVPRSVSDLLDQAVTLIRRRVGVVATLYLLPMVALELLMTPFEFPAHGRGSLTSLATVGMVFLPYIVLQGFPGYLLTWALAEELGGHRPTRQETFARAWRDAPRIAWTHLLLGLLYVAGIACGLLILRVSTILSVLPVLWVMLVCFVTVPVMCVENHFGWTALRRSRALMKGTKRGAAIVALVWLVLGLTLNGIVTRLVDEGTARYLVSTTAQALVASYVTVFTLLLYFDLRIRAESFDFERRARREAPEHAAAATRGASDQGVTRRAVPTPRSHAPRRPSQ